MLEKANKGDQAAIKALSKFSIFDSKKVAEKVNGVRVYAGQTKTIDFGDGSAITLDYQITSGGTQIPAYYTWEGDYVHAIAMHKWFLLGVEVGRYELHFINVSRRQDGLFQGYFSPRSDLADQVVKKALGLQGGRLSKNTLAEKGWATHGINPRLSRFFLKGSPCRLFFLLARSLI
jgi:hypothetical protein